MRDYYRMIKRWDVIVICMLILISLLPVAIFSYVQAGNTDEQSIYVAKISIDGQVVETVTLTGHKGINTFDIGPSAHDNNTIEVKDDKIRIKGATCTDQVCVRMGFISKPGETIVCLPHKVLIEIETINGVTDDIIISS